MNTVVLGLGSNLGDRETYLRRALHQLFPAVLKSNFRVSALYETQAILPSGAPKDWNRAYLNLAIIGQTALEPQILLEEIKKIERDLGRKKREVWAPREIDIDILTYENKSIDSPQLQIPHRELLNRPFCCLPLAELAPDWEYPIQGEFYQKTAKVLASRWPEYHPLLRTFLFSEIVGTLNITPDSFSDGGKFTSVDTAYAQMQLMIEEGARVIDIGAESTRPNAQDISSEEEWKRLEPILKKSQEFLKTSFTSNLKISLDTRHFETAKKAIEMGCVHWINDVSGLSDEKMIETIAASNVDVVFMHALGIPPSRDRILPIDQDPVELILEWATKKIMELSRRGITSSRLIFDPGIGFGKSATQSLKIIKNISRFHELGLRVLVGHSRKSFLTLFTDKDPQERDPESAAVSTWLESNLVHFIRVHDVGKNLGTMRVFDSLRRM